MDITPQDILNHEFNSKLKGVDPEEVKNFMIVISEAFEKIISEKEELKKELKVKNEELQKLKKREDVLRDTLIAAQKFSAEIKNNANKEAEILIREAELKAEDIISNAISRQNSVREEIRTLKLKRNEIENDIIKMLNSLKELIESYKKEDEDFEKIEYLGS